MDITTIIVFLVAGVIAGTLAGLIGIGGGIIYVPTILFYLEHFKQEIEDPHVIAVTTSLLIIFFSTISASSTHWKRGNVLTKHLPVLGLGAAAGAFLGVSLVRGIESTQYSILLGFLLLYIGTNIVRSKSKKMDDLKEDSDVPARKIFVTGGASGGIAAFFGVGGGLITVPLLHLNGIRLSKAVGTSTALMVLSAGFSLLLMITKADQAVEVEGIWRNIFISGALAILPTALIFSKVGARLAHHVDGPKIKRYFGVFVLIMGARWVILGANQWLHLF